MKKYNGRYGGDEKKNMAERREKNIAGGYGGREEIKKILWSRNISWSRYNAMVKG